MKDKPIKLRALNAFVISSGCILLLLGSIKIISVFGHSKILGSSDPIFQISFRSLLLVVGNLEIIIAVVCLATNNQKRAIILIFCLASSFLLYRFGLWFIGWKHPCPCMGTLTDLIPISPKYLEATSKAMLLYLWSGSFYLAYSRLNRRSKKLL
jgi:hypothetical protein